MEDSSHFQSNSYTLREIFIISECTVESNSNTIQCINPSTKLWHHCHTEADLILNSWNYNYTLITIITIYQNYIHKCFSRVKPFYYCNWLMYSYIYTNSSSNDNCTIKYIIIYLCIKISIKSFYFLLIQFVCSY